MYTCRYLVQSSVVRDSSAVQVEQKVRTPASRTKSRRTAEESPTILGGPV
jgi:hypothetical protein